jgi:hypothetical protein
MSFFNAPASSYVAAAAAPAVALGLQKHYTRMDQMESKWAAIEGRGITDYDAARGVWTPPVWDAEYKEPKKKEKQARGAKEVAPRQKKKCVAPACSADKVKVKAYCRTRPQSASSGRKDRSAGSVSQGGATDRYWDSF